MNAAAFALLFTALLADPTPAPPAACAAHDTAFLRSLVGEWDVETEFRSGEDWERAAGKASIRPELSGCVLVQRYAGTRYGKPYEFLAILGANGMGAPIQEVFAHSQHGILSLMSGKIAGGELVVEDRPTIEGRVVVLQHLYLDVGPAGFRCEHRRSTDGGATWRPTQRSKYRRAPASR